MLKLVIADDEGKQTVVPMVREEITIGRMEGNTIRLTISLGVAVADANTPITFEQLREIAADAEKEAKQTGRNRTIIRVVASPPLV